MTCFLSLSAWFLLACLVGLVIGPLLRLASEDPQ